MRISGRAIIIEDGKLLTMFRRKNGKEYYVIPGGGQEKNESLEQTVIRELKEEFSVDIDIIGYLGAREYNETLGHYYHCKIKNGTPKLGGEELDRMSEDNYYEIRYLDLDKLDALDSDLIELVQKALNKEYV
jgi:8-oxo-dGTP pyrophosphatase MutT (NUDIX family)